MKSNFEQVEGLVEANLDLLEVVSALNIKKLDKDCQAFVYSQLRRTVGVLGKIVLDGK